MSITSLENRGKLVTVRIYREADNKGNQFYTEVKIR